jgi:hypothetical protein
MVGSQDDIDDVFDSNCVSTSKGAPYIPPQLLEDAVEDLGVEFDESLLPTNAGEVLWDRHRFRGLVLQLQAKRVETDEALRRAFHECDAEGMGFLDRESFVALLATSGLFALSDEDADRLVMECDADGDGLISASDFLAFATRHRHAIEVAAAKRRAVHGAQGTTDDETEARDQIDEAEGTARAEVQSNFETHRPTSPAEPVHAVACAPSAQQHQQSPSPQRPPSPATASSTGNASPDPTPPSGQGRQAPDDKKAGGGGCCIVA